MLLAGCGCLVDHAKLWLEKLKSITKLFRSAYVETKCIYGRVMKRTVLILLSIASTCLHLLAGVKTGEKAPDFEAVTAEGKLYRFLISEAIT